MPDDRQVGVVDRLKNDNLVAGLDHGQRMPANASVPPEVTITSFRDRPRDHASGDNVVDRLTDHPGISLMLR